MLGDSKGNREDLVKSELECFDFSESKKEESSEEKDKDKFLIKIDNNSSSKSKKIPNNFIPNNLKNIENMLKN
jgi:hypothetical protein